MSSLTQEIDIAGEAVAGLMSAIEHFLSKEVQDQLLLERQTREELFAIANPFILSVNQLYAKHVAMDATGRLRQQLRASLSLEDVA